MFWLVLTWKRVAVQLVCQDPGEMSTGACWQKQQNFSCTLSDCGHPCQLGCCGLFHNLRHWSLGVTYRMKHPRFRYQQSFRVDTGSRGFQLCVGVRTL